MTSGHISGRAQEAMGLNPGAWGEFRLTPQKAVGDHAAGIIRSQDLSENFRPIEFDCAVVAVWWWKGYLVCPGGRFRAL